MTMKKYLTALLLMGLSLHASATGDNQSATWLERVHDFGTIAEADGKVSCMMRLVNTTNSEIAITEVRPSCGCTAANYPRKPIAAGDTATIFLVFNPYGRPGEFSKDVIVRLSSSPRRTILKIKGSVIAEEQTVSKKYPVSVGSLKIDNNILPFGDIYKTKNKNAYINGYNTGRDSIKVYALDIPKCVAVKAVPTIVPPGGLCAIIVHLDATKCPDDWGVTDYSFRLLSEPIHENASAYAGIARISAIANIKEDFSKVSDIELKDAARIRVSDEKIDLGKIGNNTVSRSFSIYNDGKRTLKIHKIVCSEGINASINKTSLKHGKSATVTVTAQIPQYSSASFLNSTITIITNAPQSPTTTIRIVAEK